MVYDIDRCSHNPTDFGLNCFYVGDNFSLRLDWARIRYVKYVAVLCYSVSNLRLSERESKIFETADLESVEQMVWGWIKSCHRNNCFQNYEDLKCGLPLTLDENIPIAFVRRVFNHCLRFMAGYRVGLTGAVLEYAVKKYKSHRRLSACINLATLCMEYKTKKEEQMTFKRSK